MTTPDQFPQHHVARAGTLDAVFNGPEADLPAWDLAQGPDSPGARRHELAAENRIELEHYELALKAHKAIEDRGPFYRRHAYVRHRIAEYLDNVSAAVHGAEFAELAVRLRNARTSFTWGIDFELEAPEPTMQWDNKAGLSKLCPDDARDDARKIWRRYGPRVEAELEKGYELHYMVAAPPNFDRGELRAGIDAGFKHLRDAVMYGRTDGRVARNPDDKLRRLPWLHGMLAILEDPLSVRGNWNGHYNCFLITDRKPDYKALRDAVGWHVHVEPVGGTGRPTPEQIIAAAKEAIKYPLQGIPAKSIEKSDDDTTPAPPVVAWPYDAFAEWWEAHKGLRRVRAWGSLYSNDAIDELEAGGTWLGRGRCSPSDFAAEVPLPHVIAGRGRAAPENANLAPCIKITGAAGAQGPPGAPEQPFRPTWRPGPRADGRAPSVATEQNGGAWGAASGPARPWYELGLKPGEQLGEFDAETPFPFAEPDDGR